MKTAFTVILLFLFPFTALAQGTTLDEYNYLKSGIRFPSTFSSKIKDMEKDYYFYYKVTSTFGKNFTFDGKALIRKEDNSWAGTLIIINNRETNEQSFMCIPTPFCNAEVFRKYKRDLELFLLIRDTELHRSYTLFTDYYFSLYVAMLIKDRKNALPGH